MTVIAVRSAFQAQAPNLPTSVGAGDSSMASPAAVSVGRGIFELALRAAAIAWHPETVVGADFSTETGPTAAVCLEAWRATERELSESSPDGPNRAVLEANATMLRAMYQRLYRERMDR